MPFLGPRVSERLDSPLAVLGSRPCRRPAWPPTGAEQRGSSPPMRDTVVAAQHGQHDDCRSSETVHPHLLTNCHVARWAVVMTTTPGLAPHRGLMASVERAGCTQNLLAPAHVNTHHAEAERLAGCDLLRTG